MSNKQEKHITDNDVIRTLPTNRKEVFFDLLNNRKMSLFALSCFVFMFFIPLAADLLIFNYLELLAIAADKTDYLFSLIFYSMLIAIPCLIIGFIGFAGAFYVAKKMVWQEGTMLAYDFFQGIKENWKHSLVNGFIFGVILFGLVIGGTYLYIYSPTDPIWCGIGIGALVILFIYFGIVTVLNFTQDVYYQNPYSATFKNSFRFFGLINWKVILTYLLSTGVVVGLGFINIITLSIGLFLFAVLNSVIIIIYTLVSHAAFDKYINQKHYPEMVGKGLYKDNNVKKEF